MSSMGGSLALRGLCLWICCTLPAHCSSPLPPPPALRCFLPTFISGSQSLPVFFPLNAASSSLFFSSLLATCLGALTDSHPLSAPICFPLEVVFLSSHLGQQLTSQNVSCSLVSPFGDSEASENMCPDTSWTRAPAQPGSLQGRKPPSVLGKALVRTIVTLAVTWAQVAREWL
jgi:hypothetical protein